MDPNQTRTDAAPGLPFGDVPQVDLVKGTTAGGRVTLWTVCCKTCDEKLLKDRSQLIKPTTKARAAAFMREHYALHRLGRI